jgi:hypothetical protein
VLRFTAVRGGVRFGSGIWTRDVSVCGEPQEERVMMLMTFVGANLVAQARGLAMWQGGAINGDLKTLTIWVAVAACGLVLQALVFIGFALGGYRAQKRLVEIVEEVRAKLIPVAERTHSLMEELGPKISNITANVEHISVLIKEKAEDFEPTIDAANLTIREANQTVRDANAKAHEQIVRVNGMITSALTATADVAEKIHNNIRVPVREVSAIVSGVKAALESLVSKTRGFGDGIKPNPGRTAPFGSGGYGARPASSIVRPPHSAGIEVVTTANDREIGI